VVELDEPFASLDSAARLGQLKLKPWIDIYQYLLSSY
jgi:hypothetical protein